ncbi:hypothetical protein VARIO8X_120296 [Burkholderiales bacterium 8X]|nr:hypothetical protein VARIO8X_120296 [Burkholderiales bacterium 8X]
MKIIYKDSTSAKVELNQNELLIINGALNEVCNGIAVSVLNPLAVRAVALAAVTSECGTESLILRSQQS